MQFSPLSQIRQRIRVGAPLPFGIRDHDRTLLLAVGHVVETEEQLEALFMRGALVDMAELQTPADRVKQAPAAELPGMWTSCLGQLGSTLRNCEQEGFVDALDVHAAPVLALIERDKDLAIFQVLSQEGNALVAYGVNHSIHTAITGYLIAQRLSWSADDALRVFKTGLTMNLSMLELQGQLAQQTTPLTDEQRQAIHDHPAQSRRLLELSGITDHDWLDAVDHHHVAPDGAGYPKLEGDSGNIAALVRRADIYTAKLSPRASRQSMAADKAGRMMFMQEPGNTMVMAMVKEFGVYPPGCAVRLVSGESGLVVKRGDKVMSPIVAVMNTPTGSRLTQPVRRDTAKPGQAVHSVLSTGGGAFRLRPEQLTALMAA